MQNLWIFSKIKIKILWGPPQAFSIVQIIKNKNKIKK
jgi:hypothetical protein